MNIVRPKFDRKPQCLVFVLSKKLTAIADGCRCLKGVWGVGWVKSGMCRHPKRNIQTSFLWLISLFFELPQASILASDDHAAIT